MASVTPLDDRISEFLFEVWKMAEARFPDPADREEALSSIVELMETWVLKEDGDEPIRVKIVN